MSLFSLLLILKTLTLTLTLYSIILSFSHWILQLLPRKMTLASFSPLKFPLKLSYGHIQIREGTGSPLSTPAWKIPWTEEPGRLQSMGSLRVGHDWAASLSLFSFVHWRRKWQPTPVVLPGESQGWWSLVGCRLWGRTESDTTEAT